MPINQYEIDHLDGKGVVAEPFYIRETMEPMTPEQQRQWFADAAAEAKVEGGTWPRYTVHPRDARRLLIEVWKVRPHNEGAPRFSEQATR